MYSVYSIPVAVASDLIHCFVRLTTQSDKNYKDREQLQQLTRLDEPALFAVQLLHRWYVPLNTVGDRYCSLSLFAGPYARAFSRRSRRSP